jgi:hypothetical protein
MPTICVFYGIYITMYWNDHAPPHFHANYGSENAAIAIKGGAVLIGSLPRRELKYVLQWAREHQAELMENWELCRRGQNPNTIVPLA